jgi:hypothetical protein
MTVLALVVAAVLAAASPVQGSVFGPVVSVKGSTFTITTSLSPTGKSTVSTGSAKITEPVPAPRSSLKVGACVAAFGTRNTTGVVAATRIMVSTPVSGKCGPGGRVSIRSGAGPRLVPKNAPKAPAGGFSFNRKGGFAVGPVTKLTGSTLTVKSPFGSTTVTVSARTELTHMATVKPSGITTKQCAFVQGTSADKGVTVKATSVALTQKTKGTCNAGFRGPGR